MTYTYTYVYVYFTYIVLLKVFLTISFGLIAVLESELEATASLLLPEALGVTSTPFESDPEEFSGFVDELAEALLKPTASLSADPPRNAAKINSLIGKADCIQKM